MHSHLCALDASSHMFLLPAIPLVCRMTKWLSWTTTLKQLTTFRPRRKQHVLRLRVGPYIAKEVGLVSSRSTLPESHIIDLVFRGFLTYPPKWTIVIFYIEWHSLRHLPLAGLCSRVRNFLWHVHWLYPTISSITRRLSNCVLKGFVRWDTVAATPSVSSTICTSTSTRKLRKLQS